LLSASGSEGIQTDDIVYLLGAGVNQSVRDWDDLSPPMTNNFFQIALRKEKYSKFTQQVYY